MDICPLKQAFPKDEHLPNHQTKGGADQIWTDQHFVNGPYFLCEQNARFGLVYMGVIATKATVPTVLSLERVEYIF